jgi:hypothetical protein
MPFLGSQGKSIAIGGDIDGRKVAGISGYLYKFIVVGLGVIKIAGNYKANEGEKYPHMGFNECWCKFLTKFKKYPETPKSIVVTNL